MIHHQLRNILPLVLLRASTFLPPGVFNLDKNPCRRFCTRLLGLNVQRLPPRLEDVEKSREVVADDTFNDADVDMDAGMDDRFLVIVREETERERLDIDVAAIGGLNAVVE